MYGLFATTYLLSILVLPVIARRIGPEALGNLAIAQSLGFVTAVLAEYGFNYYAAREVRGIAGASKDVRTFTAEIHTAKILLLAILLPAYWWCSGTTPALSHNHKMRLATLFCICGQSMSLIWLFQGTGRIRQYAIIEALCRTFAAIATVLTVRSQLDAWLVQLWQGAGMAISIGITSYRVRRHLCLAFPVPAALVRLRRGSASFAYRILGAVAGQMNPYVMSLAASQVNVGLFAVADKLVRLCINALQPLSEGIYPLVLRSSNVLRNRMTVSLITTVNVAVATVCGAILYIYSDPIVRLVGGDAFRHSASSLRTLVWSLPFTAFNQTISLYYLVRNNHVLAFILFALASLGLQTALSVNFAVGVSGHIGMARGLVASQALSSILLIAILAVVFQSSRRRKA